MKRISIFSLILTGVAIMFMAVPAQAVLVNYDFQVTASFGPLMGTTANGTFAFDDSIIPSGGGIIDQTNLLTSLAFTWNGIDYDANTANTGSMSFNATGNLISIGFGTDCIAGTCFVVVNQESWAFVWNQSNPSLSSFTYSVSGGDGAWTGSSSINPVSAVPEPATILLLGSGLIGFLGFGRKKFLKN